MAEQSGDGFGRSATTAASYAAGPQRFGEVGSSMEAIFGVARTAAARDLPSHAMPMVVPPGRQRRTWRVAGGMALAAAAAVAGVTIGGAVFDKAEPVVRQTPPQQIAARRQPPAVITQTVPVANLAVARATPIDPVELSGSVAVARAAGPDARIETVERAPRAVQPQKYRLADERGRSSPCDGRRGAASFACLAEQLDGADRDLVEAYSSATQAGVQRNHLVGVNRRWERARERAQDDPAETLRAYEDLTDELWTARRRALRGDD